MYFIQKNTVHLIEMAFNPFIDKNDSELLSICNKSAKVWENVYFQSILQKVTLN